MRLSLTIKPILMMCLVIVSATKLLNSSALANDAIKGKPSPLLVAQIEAIKQAQNSKSNKTVNDAFSAKYSTRIRASLAKSGEDQLFTTPFTRVKNGDQIQIDIQLKDSDSDLIEQIKATGVEIEIVNAKLKRIQAWADQSQLSELASITGVAKINTPNYGHSYRGSVTTQGDAILRANLVRAAGRNGQGVKVGIISDGGNSIASAQATGDLPSSVTRFGSCSTRSEDISNCLPSSTCNEGTAMAEIIHDIAPQAELAIAAVSTSLEFIQRLDQLSNTFGANIIVDDLGFFGEPYFQDGPLAQAVSALPEDVLYISSAGNSGNNHYEANFALAATNSSVQLHDFQTNDIAHGFIVPAQGFVVPLLQWNSNFDSPNADYDLLIGDQSTIIARSDANQFQPDVPPLEALCIPNTSANDEVYFALIERIGGTASRLEMFFLGAPAIEYPIPEGSIFGHAATERAIAVATINANDNGNDTIAFYSSRGPSRIDFPSRIDRQKPDLTGIDGVSVTGAGGFPSTFFGTSAAAPHVAGVAALMMGRPGKAKAEEVRIGLQQSAVDLGTSGRDSTYGFGRVDAEAARGAIRFAFPLPPYLILLEDD